LSLLQEVAHTPYIDLDILHTVPLKERRKLYDPVPREEENPPNSEMTCRRTRGEREKWGKRGPDEEAYWDGVQYED
jgi:hypothetical protein